ncbi:MAG: acyltransferase family protein [Saccharofermentans sp.]|jgi:peptidoglycan/LPS O-acetylase OafA/YrhL|nr:acyltransferase family protein [Mageeibacillus sp.]MCI1263575.1 acyltransferase family protein [Saccharofermentans sp.]MCI1274486.1 acyltransferase family protein [Saccharofermentans sp.]
MTRKYYIDNLRWLAILMLFPFHTAQIWNGGEYSGFYIWSHTNDFMYAFSTFVYPWYMTLLFAISGMSLKFALQKRTPKQIIVERVNKLMIPFVFGVLVLVPIMTYVAEIFFNGYTGTYLNQYILFFTKQTDLTGYSGGFTPAHLWFLLYLFVISLIALLLVYIQKRKFPSLSFSKMPYMAIILLFIPEWLMQYILNIGGKSIGQYLFLFIVGYYILADDKVLEKLKKYRLISLGIWLSSGGVYTYLYCFGEMRNELGTGLYVFFGWMGILALLGIGQTILNFTNKFSQYMSKASFPIYILHLSILVVVGYFVLKLQLNIASQFIIIVIASFGITVLLYEVVRRIPYLRTAVGIARQTK